MLIQIIRTSNRYDYVKDFMLERMIETHGIVKFKRSSGWVTIGEDMIRGNKRNNAFSGRNDRRSVHDSI